MKNILVLVISLILAVGNVRASFLDTPSPYSFGPAGRTVSDLRNFATPKMMVNILPNRPVVATDSSGNRVYYTPDGKMSLSISKDGSMNFSLGGTTKSMDSKGNLTSISSRISGTDIAEIKNEFGELLGYRQYNAAGGVSKEYDNQGNLTRTYNYDKYGKTISYITDEMSKTKTTYDELGREIAIYDADGYILSASQYQDVSYERGEDGKTLNIIRHDKTNSNGLLVSRENYQYKRENLESPLELVHTTTFFNERGSATVTKDANGYVISRFVYKQDSDGNEVLSEVVNPRTGEVTYYKNGKEDKTVNAEGTVIKQCFWNGSKLMFSVTLGKDGTWSTITRNTYTEDAKNNVYDATGNILESRDADGNLLATYVYREGEAGPDGKKILAYVKNEQDGSITYYDELGRQTYTKDKNGEITKEYSWNGRTLVFVFDRTTQTTTWYNQSMEDVYTTFNDRIISKNIYHNGQLIGVWDATTNKLTVMKNQAQWIVLESYGEEPSAADIVRILSFSSLIEKRYAEGTEGDMSDLDLNAMLEEYLNSQNSGN
ncbi:hypothetical protein MASR1M68_08420 [Elusimicrobiota bacterium]